MQLFSKLKDPSFRFSFFMWLVALHSFATGLGLIFLPGELFEKLGYSMITERFFTVQGGVFHIVMCIGYLLAAYGRERYEGVVYLSVTAKFFATFFLITYSFVISWILVVFLSGIFDFLMGVIIYILYKQHKKNIHSGAG
ncbi:MAG: hypothetical protein ABFR36_05605 [Acidobacteriota bacterium]